MTQTDVAIAWLDDFEVAQARSRELKKPIFVDVYQDDCGGCEKLEAVTFTDPRVADALVNRFVPVHLDLRKNSAFARQWQVFWTPTVLFADRSGKVRYQSPNFLPPDAMLDVMDIGEALVAMRWKEYDRAIELLNDVSERSPNGPVTAESIYWRGKVAYFRDGNSSASAHREWDELQQRFPESIWALRIP